MGTPRRQQDGFHIIEVTIVLAVIAAALLIGFKVLHKNKASRSATQQVTTSASKSSQAKPASFVQWSFDGNAWKAAGQAPSCENPLSITQPADVSKATGVLYPGQVRGGDFKPHGGLAFDNSPNGNIDVHALRSAYLYQGARYIEGGEVQYMLDFMDACGIRYRYDHLYTLTPDVMKLADELPAARADDSRTQQFSKPALFKAGAIIATAIGHPSTNNYAFDVGVYDLRSPNAASKTDPYKTDKLRLDDKEQSFYAVCWFDLLPAKEKATVKALPSRGGTKENTSDYCQV